MDGGGSIVGEAPIVSSGIVWPAASALAVLSVGIASLLRSGPVAGAVVVASLGAVLTASVLLDRPLRTTFTADGIVRTCPLRTSTMPWDSVVAIERTRTPAWRDTVSGGLVARTRRGRWLLCDRAEPPADFDDLVRLVGAAAPHVRVVAPAPHGRTR
jgi:hypothetical protein